jgi:predicted ArsR family transcriptional regulator
LLNLTDMFYGRVQEPSVGIGRVVTTANTMPQPKRHEVCGKTRQEASELRKFAILKAIAGGARTRAEIAKIAEVSTTTIDKRCTAMKIDGLVESSSISKPRKGGGASKVVQYRITKAGRKALAERHDAV